MRKAFGLLEILLIVVIILVGYFVFLKPNKYGRANPFDDNSGLKSKQEIIDEKFQEINDTKALQKRIEDNLKKGY